MISMCQTQNLFKSQYGLQLKIHACAACMVMMTIGNIYFYSLSVLFLIEIQYIFLQNLTPDTLSRNLINGKLLQD